MTTLLDTCIVIYLINETEPLHKWSVAEVTRRKQGGSTAICDIVFCEASIGLGSVGEMNAVVDAWALERMKLSDAALFRAGKAFLDYRRRSGAPKDRVLPDFLIGAAAEINRVPVMTNDRKHFERYFPEVSLILP